MDVALSMGLTNREGYALLFWHSRLWVLEFLTLMSPEFLVISLSAVQHSARIQPIILRHIGRTLLHIKQNKTKKRILKKLTLED